MNSSVEYLWLLIQVERMLVKMGSDGAARTCWIDRQIQAAIVREHAFQHAFAILRRERSPKYQ